MPNYNVTFKENKKDYHYPATRTIQVSQVEGVYSAALLIAEQFDSIKIENFMPRPANKKITILDVKEIEPEEEKVEERVNNEE